MNLRHPRLSFPFSGLKKAYRILYRDGLSLRDAEKALAELAKTTPEVQLIINLMKTSHRGLLRKQYCTLDADTSSSE